MDKIRETKKSIAENLLFAANHQSDVIRLFNSGFKFSEARDFIENVLKKENESNNEN